MVRGALEVVEFVPRQAVDAVEIDYPGETEHVWSRLRLEHRTLTSCAAALASIALHALFVAPALWAGGAPHPADLKSAGATDLQWVVLDDSPTIAAPKPVTLTAPVMAAVSLSDDLPIPERPASVPDARQDKNAQSDDDHSSLGVMYGRYVGQIQARIDRAWQRPRTSIGAPLFQCQVQVDQDGLGRVDEVTLLQCNGDASWQLSLVHAIEAASPLPAPPDPAVFARHVLLEFRAMAYSAGADAQLYEPPPAMTASHAEPGDSGPQSRNPFQALREAAKGPHPVKVIELRIEGSKTEVAPEHQ